MMCEIDMLMMAFYSQMKECMSAQVVGPSRTPDFNGGKYPHPLVGLTKCIIILCSCLS